jgi:CubicO group peptidase (beta-lactamase class C family)
MAAFAVGVASGVRAEMDAAKLKQIPARLQKFVDEGVIAGAVMLVGHKGEIASLETVGLADLGAKKSMAADSLFWIASMTKPITAVAVLMLQDEGKLSIEDPVEKYLPEFKGIQMRAKDDKGSPTLVAPPRAITLRDLLTHTAGLTDPGDLSSPTLALEARVKIYAKGPLQFEPGSRWAYSNPGINTLGRIVEVVSGTPFDRFLQERLFDPLGMKGATFYPTREMLPRIAKSYKVGANGKGLDETDIFFIKGDLTSRDRPPLGSGGLFATADDLWRFYRMMLNGGAFEGKRILSREAVALMTRTQTDDIKTGFTNGMSWGLGFQVVKEPQGVTAMLSPGAFGHGGAYGTQSWADPKKDLVLILMIQRSGLPNADASDVRRVFQETAVEAMK